MICDVCGTSTENWLQRGGRFICMVCENAARIDNEFYVRPCDICGWHGCSCKKAETAHNAERVNKELL